MDEKQPTPVEKVLEGIEKGYHLNPEKWEQWKRVYLMKEKIFAEEMRLDGMIEGINVSKESTKPKN